MEKESKELTFHQKFVHIQTEMQAGKTQTNTFAQFKFRNCSDILIKAKPFLKDLGLTLLMTDEVKSIEGRVYVAATAFLSDGVDTVSNTAYAREAEAKKGMDAAQVTGMASSYARKYALAGLLCLDDNEDDDNKTKDSLEYNYYMPIGKAQPVGKRGMHFKDFSADELLSAKTFMIKFNKEKKTNHYDLAIASIENWMENNL